MSRFLVDSRTLLAVRDKLGRLHGQLLGMHTVVGGFEGTLGGRALEGELEHFVTRWHYGIATLAGEIDEMMGRLTGAAAAYQRIEDKLAGEAASGGAPVAPGVGSGTTVIGGGRGGRSTGGVSSGAPRHTPRAVISVSSPLLTSGQETFVARLAMLTGLNPRVIGAWALAEESSSYASARQADDNHNWLNIGYFDSGPGAIAFNRAFRNPDTAAEKTAEFLEGKWGGASSSIRAILHTAGESPSQQIAAIADSDWASSHYDDGANLRGTYDELAGMTVRGA